MDSPPQTLTGPPLGAWLRRIWSPGLQTDQFTLAQRTAWQLDPTHAYVQLSTGGDAALDRLMDEPHVQALVWAWRRGGYWVLDLGPTGSCRRTDDHVPIDRLGIPTRALNRLIAANVRTFGHLWRQTVETLRRRCRLTPAEVAHVVKVIQAHGYDLWETEAEHYAARCAIRRAGREARRSQTEE